MRKLTRDFAGNWRIVELADMQGEYLEETDGKPYFRLSNSGEGGIIGEYQCGLSSGSLTGAVRVFGGERIVIFGHEGLDEMETSSGGGWLRLRTDGNLEGEFVDGLGRFLARRLPTRKLRNNKTTK